MKLSEFMRDHKAYWNTCYGSPENTWERQRSRKFSKEIMTENFPNLGKKMNIVEDSPKLLTR
jgi:hypothetical protein